MSKKYVVNLCVSGVFAALFFGLEMLSTHFSVPLFAHKIELPVSSIALCVVALQCGPLWGGATALVGGFLAQLWSPYGLAPTTPLWIVPAVCQAIVIGLLYRAFKVRQNYFTALLSILIGQFVLTLLNSAAIWCDGKIYGYPTDIISIVLVLRLAAGSVAAIAFAALCQPMLKTLKHRQKASRVKKRLHVEVKSFM